MLTCFSEPAELCPCLNGRMLQLPSTAVGLSGIAPVSKGKFRPFLLFVALFPKNIECLSTMVMSNDETNTGEFSIYKNLVKKRGFRELINQS